MSQNVPLSPGQCIAVAALLSGANVGKTAELAGVSRRTISRWLGDSHFQAAQRQAEAAVLEDLTAALARAGFDAVALLTAVVRDTTTPTSVRVVAGRTVLDLLARYRTLTNVEQRLAALEAGLGAGLAPPAFDAFPDDEEDNLQ